MKGVRFSEQSKGDYSMEVWGKKNGHYEEKRKGDRKELSSEPSKLEFKCSRNGKYWFVLLEKTDRTQSFKIASVATDVTGQSDYRKSTAPESIDIDLKKIENSERMRCPHCGSTGWVKCSCGKLSCAGGVVEKSFDCPWCNCHGLISGTFETVRGEIQNKARFKTAESPRTIGKDEFPRH